MPSGDIEPQTPPDTDAVRDALEKEPDQRTDDDLHVLLGFMQVRS